MEDELAHPLRELGDLVVRLHVEVAREIHEQKEREEAEQHRDRRWKAPVVALDPLDGECGEEDQREESTSSTFPATFQLSFSKVTQKSVA